MTDRELLERAAKAAGIVVQEWPSDTAKNLYAPGYNPKSSSSWWNPLTNDGDRYRLARKLGLDIDWSECVVLDRAGKFCERWTRGDERGEALAIVRVAAALADECASS